VDCCLGGFLVPFMEKAGFPLPCLVDFRAPGVTSISCDPHKYGFAPKGCSVLMFREKTLRHYMYCFITEWSGGIYATPTMLGSRPGGPVAATWAAMMKHGEAGYIETTKEIVGATKTIAEGVRSIDGLDVLGRPDVCVVAFAASAGSGLNAYSIADCMKGLRGWALASLQNPSGVHLALTHANARNAEQFVTDLRKAVEIVKNDTEKKFNDTAGIYGMAASLPAAFIEESVKVYLDCCTKVTASEGAGPTKEEDKDDLIPAA